MKPILDPCCGPKMFYFDKNDPRVLFCDIRAEEFDKFRDGGTRVQHVEIKPDMICDFTNQPHPDDTFHFIPFDPPHLIGAGLTGFMAKQYGRLSKDNWQEVIRKGFAECFRVLKPNGILLFKWNETHIPLAKVLELTPEKPVLKIVGGRADKTHAVVFLNEKISQKKLKNFLKTVDNLYH